MLQEQTLSWARERGLEGLVFPSHIEGLVVFEHPEARLSRPWPRTNSNVGGSI
jgi:hypothetical protein